jgi:hypothetical protein
MVHSLPDLTATTGTLVPLSATSQKATWVSIQAGPTSTANARVGDSSITSTRGGIITMGSGYFFYPTAGNTREYDLSNIYVLGTTGDKFAILYDVN